MSRYSPTVHRYDPQSFAYLQNALQFAGQRQSSLALQEQTDRRTTEMEKSGAADRERIKALIDAQEQQSKMNALRMALTEASARQQYGLERDRRADHEPVPATVRAPMQGVGASAPAGMQQTAQAPQMKGATIPQYELGDARNRLQLSGGYSIARMGEAPADVYREEQLGKLAGKLQQSGYGEPEAYLKARGVEGDMTAENVDLAKQLESIGATQYVERYRKEHGHDSYRADETGAGGWGAGTRENDLYGGFMLRAKQLMDAGVDPDEAYVQVAQEFRGAGLPIMDPKSFRGQTSAWQEGRVEAYETPGFVTPIPGLGDTPEAQQAAMALGMRADELMREGMSSNQDLIDILAAEQPQGGLTPQQISQWMQERSDAASNRKMMELIMGRAIGGLAYPGRMTPGF